MNTEIFISFIFILFIYSILSNNFLENNMHLLLIGFFIFSFPDETKNIICCIGDKIKELLIRLGFEKKKVSFDPKVKTIEYEVKEMSKEDIGQFESKAKEQISVKTSEEIKDELIKSVNNKEVDDLYKKTIEKCNPIYSEENYKKNTFPELSCEGDTKLFKQMKHLSNKNRESIDNSIRSRTKYTNIDYFKAELDEHANRVWWDNDDLEQIF